MATAMAAVVPPYSGGKLYATNDGRFTFVNVLFDVEGRLLATLDGDAITAPAHGRRLGAGDPPPGRADAAVAAVIGTGPPGLAPPRRCCCATLPGLAELRICGRRHDGRAGARRRARVDGHPAVAAHDDPADAVDGADVVVTVTAAREPLFPATAVADDALICAVGATKYDRAEIGAELVARCAAVVCDDVAGRASSAAT